MDSTIRRETADQTHEAYQTWKHTQSLVVQAARALLSGGDISELRATVNAEELARALFISVAE